MKETHAHTLSKILREADWDKEDAREPRRYMVGPATGADRLPKAPSKYLHQRTVVLGVVPMLVGYRDQLRKVFKEADTGSETGRRW